MVVHIRRDFLAGSSARLVDAYRRFDRECAARGV
jgi:hypothetical protein